MFCQVQSIGLTILSQTNTRAISLDGEPGLLLTAALCSKPVHWAGGLSGWVTSDSRNVLSGLSTAEHVGGAAELRASGTLKHSKGESIKNCGWLEED